MELLARAVITERLTEVLRHQRGLTYDHAVLAALLIASTIPMWIE